MSDPADALALALMDCGAVAREQDHLVVRRSLGDGETSAEDICQAAFEHGATVRDITVQTNAPDGVGTLAVELEPADPREVIA